MAPPPLVSIVIPAKNASRTIGACLTAIRQHVPAASTEAIVVDNGSTDGTASLASEYPVRIISVPRGFVSKVRNAGARVASGSIVAFVDADCTVLPGWYEAVVSGLSDPGVGVVGSRLAPPEPSTWSQRVWQDAQLKRDANRRREVPYVPAGNLALRREVFLSVGGFDERLETGEDPDLCVRVAHRGYRIVSEASMRSIHLGEPSSLLHVFRRERWHGRGARVTYSGGRVAPITMATLAFAGLLGLGVAGLVLRPIGAPAAILLAAPLSFVVPLGLALRYRPAGRPWQTLQLWAVYCAYLLGRAAALPTVFGRTLSPPRSEATDVEA
ncbi:MAG: glycosyltransferase [Vicinamibacterales bacterium]